MGKRIIKGIKQVIDEILDIIYPPEEICISCGEEGFIGLCHICRNKIKRDIDDDFILSYGQYGGVLKKVILSFKYKKNFTSGKIISELMKIKLEEIKYVPDIILYVPIDKIAKRKRGFNQCEFIAKELSKSTGAKAKKYIKKVKKTREQKRLSLEERKLNIKNVFKLEHGELLNNKRILIIDDVVTSGSTLYECLKLINSSEIKDIKLLTVARSKL